MYEIKKQPIMKYLSTQDYLQETLCYLFFCSHTVKIENGSFLWRGYSIGLELLYQPGPLPKNVTGHQHTMHAQPHPHHDVLSFAKTGTDIERAINRIIYFIK